jgi:16S rRNA (guanine527-N7)-methyltransferase
MNAEQIEAAVRAIGLQPLAPRIAEKFQDYLELLLKWNAKLNLTAIREPEAILKRHFLECIFLAQQLPSGIHTLLDFGAGGGFPGLPIALCRPEIHVTLGESQGKKAGFLREAVRTLEVDATVFQGRIETLGRLFDAVVLRAVDKMQEAVLVAQSKVAPEGWLILFATEESDVGLRSSLLEWTWRPPLRIPGSGQEILLFGQRLVNVPRGTNGVEP